MRTFTRIAAIYLLVLLGFLWGLAVPILKVFPYSYLEPLKDELVAFLVGGTNEDTSLGGKLLNDLGLAPERMLREFKPAAPERFAETPLDGTRERRGVPRVHVAPEAPRVYRAIVGAFDFEEAFWGAILLDPDGTIVHRWAFNGEIEGYSEDKDVQKNLYGTAFMPDGSAIFTMQEKVAGIVKVDRCSTRQWISPGVYHHTIEPTQDRKAFWTFGGKQGQVHPVLTLIDADSGKILKTIDMADVERANPGLFIFDLRAVVFNDNDDATHPNDIDPLPPELAEAFPMFEAGDLALSYRTTNQILVVDPDTLKVKWYSIGQVDSQHDPDWRANGTISVFSNNTRLSRRSKPPYYSDIVALDPATGESRVTLKGADYDFFSAINGHHALTPEGTVVVTSSTQGRVFEVDPETGAVVFEFINAYDWDEGRTLHLSQAFVVDDADARRWTSEACDRIADQGGQG